MLPLPPTVETEYTTTIVPGNGMHAEYYETVYCAATEPHATFVHVSVSDGGQEVAYETAVLGRLRNGYRVFQMRSLLGTRIELAYLFVRIRSGSQPKYAIRDRTQDRPVAFAAVFWPLRFHPRCGSQWVTPRQVCARRLCNDGCDHAPHSSRVDWLSRFAQSVHSSLHAVARTKPNAGVSDVPQDVQHGRDDRAEGRAGAREKDRSKP